MPSHRPANTRRHFSVYLALAMLAGLAVAAYVGRLPFAVVYAYLVLSLLTFALYAWDKRAAVRDRPRIRERTLHLLALAGGWPGALLGQQWLRHKSQKSSFRRRCWLTVALNTVLLGWYCSEPGRRQWQALLHQAQAMTNWI